jgi:hypothetical protein
LADILKNLAEIGASYEDALDLLRKADDRGHLNCGLYHDALPRPADMQELARLGKQDPTLQSAPATVSRTSTSGQ